MENIKSAIVNWYYTTEHGEEYHNIVEGDYYNGSKVSQLLYRKPTERDNRHFVKVELEDGRTALEFNVNSIVSKLI